MKSISLLLSFIILTISYTIAAQSDIVSVAVSSKKHSTLAAAIKVAGLVTTLKGEGPFTVFGPTNEAFDSLPSGTLADLFKPEFKERLNNILTYHVIPGNFKAIDLISRIEKSGGTLSIKTVNEGTLEASIINGNIVLKGATGITATIIATDLNTSNGVIHVIDAVLMPE